MVPHCIIDECTIASYKSGQQLEIIYTTDNILLVTPTKLPWSLLELARTFICTKSISIFCTNYSKVSTNHSQWLYHCIVSCLQRYAHSFWLINGAIQWGYNLSMPVSRCFVIHQPLCATNSHLMFYTIQFIFMQGLMVPEAFATCILAHIVYIMYYSNKLCTELPIMKLFKRHTIYITSVLGLLASS